VARLVDLFITTKDVGKPRQEEPVHIAAIDLAVPAVLVEILRQLLISPPINWRAMSIGAACSYPLAVVFLLSVRGVRRCLRVLAERRQQS